MNRLSNPHQRLEEGNNNFTSYESQAQMMFKAPKKSVFMPSESLFSMALYDFDTSAQCETGGMQHSQQHQQQRQPQQRHPQPTFHPVEEYKDLSLKEILDLSDDFIFGDEDPMMSSHLLMEPVPCPVPSRMTSQVSHQVVPSVPTPQVTPSYHFSDGSGNDMGLTLDLEAASKKRQREACTNDVDDDDCSEEGRRFRPYQAGQWAEKFEELCEYRHTMGHCLVPHTYGENLPLARWVKRQRYQYKLMVENKQSTMTDERVTALEDIGFVWDSQGAAWAERLNELAEFRKIYLHCNVPSNYSENSQLATWVKCQRRQYKLHVEGKASNMTPLRISSLEIMGFEWELRSYKKARGN
jgi:hypothetical protein